MARTALPVLASVQQLQPFSSTVLPALTVSPIKVEQQRFSLLPIVAMGGLLAASSEPSDCMPQEEQQVEVESSSRMRWWFRSADGTRLNVLSMRVRQTDIRVELTHRGVDPGGEKYLLVGRLLHALGVVNNE